MQLNRKKLILGFSLSAALFLTACVSTNSVMFGTSKLNLEYSELQSRTANLFYSNYKDGIGVGVVREVMPNADTHLQPWTKAMLADQEQKRGRPLVEKQHNAITYYEVIDKNANVKILYLFGTNTQNSALQMKFSKFPVDAEVSSAFIQDLNQFKAF